MCHRKLKHCFAIFPLIFLWVSAILSMEIVFSGKAPKRPLSEFEKMCTCLRRTEYRSSKNCVPEFEKVCTSYKTAIIRKSLPYNTLRAISALSHSTGRYCRYRKYRIPLQPISFQKEPAVLYCPRDSFKDSSKGKLRGSYGAHTSC